MEGKKDDLLSDESLYNSAGRVPSESQYKNKAWKPDIMLQATGFRGSCIECIGSSISSPFSLFSILDGQSQKSSLFEAIFSGDDFSTDSFLNSWGMELKSDDFVLVRVRGQHGNIIGENDEMMPKAEAICMVCFNEFTAEDVLMTKCKCKSALVHEDCSKNRDNNCRMCDEEIHYVHVILISDKQSFPTMQKLEEKSSTATRYWRMLSKKLLRKKK